MKDHTCRDEGYFSVVPFKPCFQCMAQLSKNSAERHNKSKKK